MTELQQVLAAIDANPGQTTDELVEATGLGVTVVRLIVAKLDREEIIHEMSEVTDSSYRWDVTQLGDEIMGTRAAASEAS